MAAILVSELVLRVYNPIRSTARANDIVLPSFKTFVTRAPNNPKGSAEIRIQYNSMGFRGPERPANFRELKTILTVGGSTTECVGLTDGATWPDHLRIFLSERMPGCWLNNAGFNGQSTFGHLILLEKYITQIAPKYVVLLVGVNDVGRTDLNNWDEAFETSSISLRDRILQASEVLSTLQTLFRFCRAVDLGVVDNPDMRFADLPVLAGVARSPEYLALVHQSTLAGYQGRLEKIVTLCKRRGIVAVFVTQPAMCGCHVDPTTGVDFRRLRYREDVGADEQWTTLELYNEVTRRVAKVHGVPLVDLARTMPKDSKYYFDWMHYSLEGAALVAELVGKDLLEVLRH